jgi:hypothetical protein
MCESVITKAEYDADDMLKYCAYVDKNPKATIISIVTRRSMGCCHLSAFNKDSEIIEGCE